MEWWGPGAGGGRVGLVFTGDRVSLAKMNKVPGMDGGDGYSAL